MLLLYDAPGFEQRKDSDWNRDELSGTVFLETALEKKTAGRSG